jgi:excisionase family DNA binding protein
MRKSMTKSELEISPTIYYTPKESAQMLRISRKKMTKMLVKGQIPAIKIGQDWRILGSDLLQIKKMDYITSSGIIRPFQRRLKSTCSRMWKDDEDSIYDDI